MTDNASAPHYGSLIELAVKLQTESKHGFAIELSLDCGHIQLMNYIPIWWDRKSPATQVSKPRYIDGQRVRARCSACRTSCTSCKSCLPAGSKPGLCTKCAEPGWYEVTKDFTLADLADYSAQEVAIAGSGITASKMGCVKCGKPTEPAAGYEHCPDCAAQLTAAMAAITLPSADGYDAKADMDNVLEGGPCPGCGRRIDRAAGFPEMENFNWCDDCDGLGLEWREGRWFRQPLTSRKAPRMPVDVETLQRSLRGLRSGFAACVSKAGSGSTCSEAQGARL